MKFLAFIVGLFASVALAAALGREEPAQVFSALLPEVTLPPTETDAVSQPDNPLPVAFQPQERLLIDVEGATQAWQDWIVRHNVEAATMALGFGQEIVGKADHKRSADAPYPVASLSKAITAICLQDVLVEHGLNWGTTLGDLAPALTSINMPPHAGVAGLSLGAFATHTTGFPKNIDGNETAGEGRNLYSQQHFAREALTNPARQKADRKHFYSNVNYAVLGQVITALTGTPYGETCSARVTVPAGALDAVVGGRMWATAGFGGWSVSATDYARFVMHWLGPDRPWINTPGAFPFDVKNRAGLGVFIRERETGFVVQHSGLWRSKSHPTRRHGAFFTISETGATFVANWQGNLGSDAYADLRKAVGPYLR